MELLFLFELVKMSDVSIFDYLCRIAANNGTSWHISCDNSSRSDDSSFANAHSSHDDDAVSEPHKVANRDVFVYISAVIRYLTAFVVVVSGEQHTFYA